jgi:hypothetical protein
LKNGDRAQIEYGQRVGAIRRHRVRNGWRPVTESAADANSLSRSGFETGLGRRGASPQRGVERSRPDAKRTRRARVRLLCAAGAVRGRRRRARVRPGRVRATGRSEAAVLSARAKLGAPNSFRSGRDRRRFSRPIPVDPVREESECRVRG